MYTIWLFLLLLLCVRYVEYIKIHFSFLDTRINFHFHNILFSNAMGSCVSNHMYHGSMQYNIIIKAHRKHVYILCDKQNKVVASPSPALLTSMYMRHCWHILGRGMSLRRFWDYCPCPILMSIRCISTSGNRKLYLLVLDLQMVAEM